MTRFARIKRILTEAATVIDRTNAGLIAAGIAFFGIFAIFPGLAALIALFGLLADPAIVAEQLALLQDIIPPVAYDTFSGQLETLLSASGGTLGWATVLSTTLALWAARGGIAALMRGLNAVYDRPNRSGLRHAAVAMLLTISLFGVAILALLTVVILPIVFAFLNLGAFTEVILNLLKWVIMIAILIGTLSILYRYGPNLRGKRPRWITPGAVAAVFVWGAASMLFSIYLANFARYNEVYGSLGAVIALLMWLYISAYVLLLGAVMDVVIEGRKSRKFEDEPGDPTLAEATSD